MYKIAKSNTAHKIHGNTAKANYRNLSTLAEPTLAIVPEARWETTFLDYTYRGQEYFADCGMQNVDHGYFAECGVRKKLA